MMKKLLTVLATIAISLSAMAEVPSLINYQGKLSDKSGNPVNGTKNFTVRIFDAKEGGKEVYEEEVGVVAVKDGLYSFGFGEAGKSVVTPTEILARTDGEKQVFNYITKNKPILGNVKISGAGLSWTDDAGSSDTSKFTSTLNKNSGAASAIFLTQAPDSGTEVLISYDHNSDGVMGALSRGGQSWLEITVGGETLSPRERLVTVPFAFRSMYAENSTEKQEIVLEEVGPHIPLKSLGGTVSIVRGHKKYLPNENNSLIFRLNCWGTTNDENKLPKIRIVLRDYLGNIDRSITQAIDKKVWTPDKVQVFEVIIKDLPRGFYYHDGYVDATAANLRVYSHVWTRK